jgi:hypothetical protein
MMRDEPACLMWDGEAIAEVVGREIARHDDAALWTHEPFLEWLAADRRAQTERRARTGDDAEMLRQGCRLRARLLARQSGVGIVEAPPRLLAPARAGLPAAVMDDAWAAGAVACVDLAAAAGAGRELWDEPAEHWVGLPPGMPRVRALALRIAGESMAPLLRSGDTVLVELGTSPTRGRVVVARHPGLEDGYVCKRVERVGRRELLLASLDAAYGTVTIPRDERLIVGTVRLVWRGECPAVATSE